MLITNSTNLFPSIKSNTSRRIKKSNHYSQYNIERVQLGQEFQATWHSLDKESSTCPNTRLSLEGLCPLNAFLSVHLPCHDFSRFSINFHVMTRDAKLLNKNMEGNFWGAKLCVSKILKNAGTVVTVTILLFLDSGGIIWFMKNARTVLLFYCIKFLVT